MTNLEVFPIIVPNRFGLKTVNFYLVKYDQHLSLIDAGYYEDDSWEALLKVLNEHSFSLEDITEIILTHHHIDHVGLVNRICDQHPIPIYCSPLSIPRLKRDKQFMLLRIDFFKKLYEEMGCGKMGNEQVAVLEKSLDHFYKAIKGDLLPIHESKLFIFDCINFPGHAPDQIGFYEKEQKYLFAGDLLIEHISSNAIVEPDENGNRIPSLMQHIESLKKCAAINVNKLFSGHGDPITEPRLLIEKRLNRIEDKSERILQYVQSGVSTGNELAIKMYREKYKEEFSLVMSEIIGHLDYLEKQNKVTKKLINGVWHYETQVNISMAVN